MNDPLVSLPTILRGALALVPALFLLASLTALDSYRLVPLRRVGQCLLAGGGCAAVGYVLNNGLLDLLGMPLTVFAVAVAPVVEESLKAIVLGWLIATRRVGFLIDGAIVGFAVGTGFSLVENLYYLRAIPDADLVVWLVRGLGTALMHGGAAAVFAIVATGFRRGPAGGGGRPWAGALALSVLLHAAFNRFMDRPLLATAAVVILVPLVLAWVYREGERRLERWLGEGLDRDAELLGMIRSGRVGASPLGEHLAELKDRFRGDMVADMLCLLRLQAELNIMVRGRMLLLQHGHRAPLPEDVADRLREVRYLETSLGRTGLLALRPVGRWRGRHPWQRRWLEDAAG